MNGIGFSYEIIRDYLIKEGGKVEYHKLIKHFKDALANPENKEARVLFKDLVNQVAIVTTEGNQKFLSLRTNLIEQPPKLPPRSTSHTDNQLNYNDSRINLNYPTTSNYQQSTANQYYDTQNKLSSQSQLNQITQQSTSNKYMNQQFNHLQQQQNYNQQQRIHSNIDLTMNMMNNQLNNHQFNNPINQNKNQFNILDTQPRQPFSYNLNQPIPALLNQRIHPAEMNNPNNLDLNNVLIQPKPVPQIQQMPINNLMNVNLVNRYSNQNKQLPNIIDNQPPLPAKNMWSNQANNEPPKAPPRRKSFASSSNTYLNKKSTTINSVKDNENFSHSSPKQFTDKLKEINELKFNSPGRVKEHAKKLNKMVSESELKLPMPLGNNNSTNIQNNQMKDDTDLNDQVKRRWMVNSSCCDYNELQQMLKDYPKLAEFKDISSGWTAIHWAAKFNKPDIIKLIAGTHNVNPNIKTFSGYTPIHIAALFDNKEIIELLTKGYDADPTIRDHTGRTAEEILRINRNKNRIKPAENGLSRKNEQETGKGFLARTASLRQTHKLLDRLPSKYRTNPK